MTLILGINLTDSVYLAADTRVTRMRGDEVMSTHDDLMKIWGNNEGIFCAVAGDAGLAKYLLTELGYEAFARRGIESLRENIEAFVLEKAEAYWKSQGESSHATLMFAGSSKHRRAFIERDLVKNLIEAHTSNSEARNEGLGQKFITYSQISSYPDDRFRTNIYATDLFAVQISHAGVSLKDTKPGQHLVFGSPDLVHEDVELKDIARIEFGEPDNAPMLVTSYLNTMREKRNLQGVGNTVIPINVQPDGTALLLTGTVYRVATNGEGAPIPEEVSSISVDAETGTFFRLKEGNRTALIPILDYHPADNMSLLIM